MTEELRSLTEVSPRALLPLSLLQAFKERLVAHGISSDRESRLRLAELLNRIGTLKSPAFESGAKTVLRSELVVEFEKQGLSTEDSLKAAEMFFEVAERGGL